MQTHRAPFRFGDAWYEKAGSAFMNVARSGVGLFKDIRGDSENQVVTGPPSTNYANLAVYGTLAALALLVVVQKPKRAA